MSTSPLVTDQLHKQNITAPDAQAESTDTQLTLPDPKVWASVDLPSLNLSDPVGTTVRMSKVPKLTPNPALKNAEAVPTPKVSTMSQTAPLGDGLEARMAQLRATSASLRRETDDVRRSTGNLK
jgi:hypothetical protein